MRSKYSYLIKLYEAYIDKKIFFRKNKCPTPNEILKCLRLESSKKQKIKIIDHLAQCFYCAQEFKFSLEILRSEKKLLHEINKSLANKNEELSNQTESQENLNRKKNQKKLFLQLSLKYVCMLIISIIIISLASILILKNSENNKYRGISSSPIILIEPNKKKVFKSTLLFKWSEIKESNYYIVELFNEALFPIWKSDKIFENQTSLSDEISKKLTENKTYFWMVTAYLSSGKNIESELEEFTFKK